MGRIKLTFDWANARAKDGALWIDCHDGSNIVAKISQDTMNAAIKGASSDLIDHERGRRQWLETAIRRRYIATRASGGAAKRRPDHVEVLIVGKEDFA
ncbi:hypothetical protein [Sphingobium phenoxybenzoativorans]|uniref:hypothetical protein n=1 Tax=Sphingobium phenoxybenzoativorans TaxID=1592790 RepID=UPI000871C695|nr:hypothetical protein [Sphingobium phenoxybenzoativorans]